MPTARFRSRLFSPRSLLLLWLTVILPLATSPQQSQRATVSITIDPPETTLHVGQRQKFSAVLRGSHNAGVEWAVEGQEGGSITQEGVYTAPRIIGIYHVIAIATTKGTALARAMAKVTVVTEYVQTIAGRLPTNVHPAIGPDATGAGWVYEYVLVDHSHKQSLADLRSLQDWHLRYQLATVPGVAEVASIGGLFCH